MRSLTLECSVVSVAAPDVLVKVWELRPLPCGAGWTVSNGLGEGSFLERSFTGRIFLPRASLCWRCEPGLSLSLSECHETSCWGGICVEIWWLPGIHCYPVVDRRRSLDETKSSLYTPYSIYFRMAVVSNIIWRSIWGIWNCSCMLGAWDISLM